jgi:hypothetical protein
MEKQSVMSAGALGVKTNFWGLKPVVVELIVISASTMCWPRAKLKASKFELSELHIILLGCYWSNDNSCNDCN